MVSKVEFETIDTRSLELESSISHMTIIFEVRTIYRLHTMQIDGDISMRQKKDDQKLNHPTGSHDTGHGSHHRTTGSR